MLKESSEELKLRKTLQKSSITFLEWDDIERLTRKLAETIKNSDFTPDIIVAIQRGGCIPAVFLSHLLKVQNFHSIAIRTTVTDEIKASRHIPKILDNTSLLFVSGKRVLVVDDITNTGATIRYTKAQLLNSNCREVRTAVLVWDKNNAQSNIADYCVITADDWVVFPWEK
jgi:hypoxanthine phosphoribosyltransferase